MDFCCLGSGSKGNATLVKWNETLVMVDCGFGIKSTVERLEKVNCKPDDIAAILVTHEHSDHIAGVGRFSKRFNIPVYATKGTARSGKLDKASRVEYILQDQAFTIGQINILPVPVPHDAIEPCQYVFNTEHKRLGIMTDLGSISSHVLSAFGQCDALLLEANHDLNMLWSGQYPPSLKQRVAGDWGHLSNEQALQFLRNANLEKLNTLVLGHLSEQNNHLDIVKNHFSEFENKISQLVYANQADGFHWLKV